jgi:hypothetical protein
VTAPVVYKSSDSSAPTLDGQAGSLVAVLDACLVNGYGSKSAAGWTKPYSATNKGVYLGSAGHYLDVDDSGAGAATTQEANVRGYETMSAVATGTGPFPTTAQAASPGLYIRKSAAANSTTRGWVLIADGTTFHLFTLPGDTANVYNSFTFGRFYSFKSSDTYRSLIFTKSSSGSAGGGLGIGAGASPINLTGGLYVPRTYLGTGTSLQGGYQGIGTTLSGPFNGPNPPDSLVYLSRFLLHEGSAASGLRGYLRGVYQLVTAAGMADGDTFSGTGDFAGRTFLVIKGAAGSATTLLALETTAWDSSS